MTSNSHGKGNQHVQQENGRYTFATLALAAFVPIAAAQDPEPAPPLQLCDEKPATIVGDENANVLIGQPGVDDVIVGLGGTT